MKSVKTYLFQATKEKYIFQISFWNKKNFLYYILVMAYIAELLPEIIKSWTHKDIIDYNTSCTRLHCMPGPS